MSVPPAILAALKTIPAQDVTLDTADTAVRMIHRKLADAEVYLFFNESAQPVKHTLNLRTVPASIEVWDPQTGTAKGSSPSLQLAPYESRVLVVR